jgi:hypothetical protein
MIDRDSVRHLAARRPANFVPWVSCATNDIDERFDELAKLFGNTNIGTAQTFEYFDATPTLPA